MSDSNTLKTLLKEYEQKRLSHIMEAEHKKNLLYNSNNDLQKIDNELNTFAINISKSILNRQQINTYQRFRK